MECNKAAKVTCLQPGLEVFRRYYLLTNNASTVRCAGKSQLWESCVVDIAQVPPRPAQDLRLVRLLPGTKDPGSVRKKLTRMNFNFSLSSILQKCNSAIYIFTLEVLVMIQHMEQ